MNIYISCGFYAGGDLQKYIDKAVVDNSWSIYAFEPNPEIIKDKYFSEYPQVTFIEKAAWTYNGEINFWIAGRHNAAHIDGTSSDSEDSGELITVPCIDFSEYIKDLPEAYIICSMDIEGSEFNVLEKMLKDNTINKISILDIEFHHRLMPKHTQEDAQKLIDKIEARGVEVRLKEPLI